MMRHGQRLRHFAVPLLPSSSPRACKPPRGSSEIKPAGRDRKGSHQHCSSTSESERVCRGKLELNQEQQVQSFEGGLIFGVKDSPRPVQSTKLQVTDQLLRAPEQVRVLRIDNLTSDRRCVAPRWAGMAAGGLSKTDSRSLCALPLPVEDFPPHFRFASR